jgi:hypothetical protein
LQLIRFCEYSIEASEQKQILKIKIMTFNNKTMQKVSSYETPSVTTLEVLSEGVLCMSSPNSTIEDATEDDWGTL